MRTDPVAVCLDADVVTAGLFSRAGASHAILVLGEVGLTGEVRAVGQVDTRIVEMKKMGFTRCLIPESNLKRLRCPEGIELIGIGNVEAAMEVLF